MDSVSKNKKIDPDQAWKTAADLLRNSMHFSSSLTTTIRTLRINESDNLNEGNSSSHLNSAGKFYLMRLLRVGSILAPFYYLTKTFKAKQIEDKEYLSGEDIVSLYKLDEVCAVLALAYVFNSLRKICDKEEWGRYAKFANEITELGGCLGINIPDIGLARGLLLSGMRALSLAVFLSQDMKAYKIYRRDTKIKKVCFDLQMEYDLFGCTHVEIATQMIQSIGFGVDYSADLYKSILTEPDKKLQKMPNIMRILLLWNEALYMNKKPPAILGENEIIVSDEVLDRVIMISKQIQEDGSAFSWLSKNKKSISRKLAPQLYKHGDPSEFEEFEEEAAYT